MRSPLAPDVEFTPISPAYRTVQLIRALAVAIPFIVALVLAIIFLPWWLTILVALAFVIYLGCAAVYYLASRYWGYAEAEEELMTTRGRLVSRLLVVPYGRMQEVNVSSGPLMRKFGLATISMETASTDADAKIPGITQAEADRLRVKLTELGQARMEGL